MIAVRDRRAGQGTQFALVIALLAIVACQPREPLTAARAASLVEGASLRREPVYAEVPQRVWWSAKSPKDAYDEKALRTLRNLESLGLIVVADTSAPGMPSFEARVTTKGFPVLGTVPSARGPALRAQICSKVYDGLRNFQQHPSDPTIGSGELVWHYADPTPLYAAFETKIEKPLVTPFASILAFRYENHQWKFSVVVPKTKV